MLYLYRISFKTVITILFFGLLLAATSMFSYHYYKTNRPTNVVCIFAHGLRQNHQRAKIYEKTLNVPLISFDFPDVFNHRETDFAQERDLKHLEDCYNTALASIGPRDGIVLMGVSRGAAAVINFASKQPKQLKGIIVEAPFDTVQSVKASLLNNFGCFSEPLADTFLACMFPNYKHDGIQPIDAIKLIDSSIPVLIICTEEDIIAPKSCSIRLCEELRNFRSKTEQNIHLAMFNKGSHAGLIEEFPAEYHALFNRFFRLYKFNAIQL